MQNQALDIVVAHLQQIAKRSQETAGDISEKRALVDDYFTAHPSVMETTVQTIPVAIEHLSAEWIIGKNYDPARRLLYIHGGSWMAGRVEKYRPHIGRLADCSQCAILAIDYRLTPESPFPAGLNDCVMAFEWMCKNGPAGPDPASATFIAGDSAGGNLTLASLLKMRDEGLPLPEAVIAMSAATDLSWSSDSIVECADVEAALNPEVMPLITRFYLQNGEDPNTPYASPVFADLSGLPPLLLQCGDAEILLDDTRRFAEKARNCGVEVKEEIYQDMPHVFQGFAPFLPEATEALNSIGEFIRSK